jgi:hypothetical protein
VDSWRCVKGIQEEYTASLVVVVVVVVVHYTCKTLDPYFSKKKLIRNEQSGVQLFNTVTNTAKYKTPQEQVYGCLGPAIAHATVLHPPYSVTTKKTHRKHLLRLAIERFAARLASTSPAST